MDKTMTVKEVSEILNISRQLVSEKVKEFYPEIVKNGITTSLNQEQITKIKIELGKNSYLPQLEKVNTDLEMLLLSKKVDQWKDNKIEQLQQENLQLKSDVKLLVHDFQKTFTTSEIAKELQMKSAQELNKKLVEMKIQYKRNGTWVLYSPYSEKNYTSIKETILENGHITYDRNWTGEGRMFILRLFNDDQILKIN
jgi:DNA-binding Lrp family transcriptional regulator